MAGEVTRVPDLSWFTAEVQNDIIEAAKFGLKVKWVALKCGVNPKALVAILDTGARRDAPPELRRFFRRWMDGKTALMSELHERWVRGDGGAGTLLRELFPEAYGKDAEPDYQPFSGQSSAEDLAQLKAIVENPAAFGDEVYQLFEAAGRLRADGT